MGIYRGPGGTGDAVNDASSEAVLTVQAKDAALAAQAAASTSATNASNSATAAAASATAAAGYSIPSQTGNNNKYLKTDGTFTSWDALDISTADVTGTLPLANGGTGSTTAANARTSLGVTATGADTTYAYRANNLSDLASASTARTNLGLAIGTNVQAWDGDLDAIAAISGTSGLLKKTSANTWTLDTNTYLTSAVTSVTGTAPVVSSGGITPVISMAAANTTTSGYLTNTDWNIFNGKGSGTVTSVSATVPSFLSLSGSPITTSGTLALTYSGTALPVTSGGTGVTTSTGSGNNVLSTSPTLVTPVLGTPTSGNLANCTLPVGTVLQVIQGSTNTTTTVTSGSLASTSLATTITPKSSTSKILIIISAACLVQRNAGTDAGCGLGIYRGATQVFADGSMYLNLYYASSSVGNIRCRTPLNYVDSPATTSATTYTLYIGNYVASTAILNADNQYSFITLMEIAA